MKLLFLILLHFILSDSYLGAADQTKTSKHMASESPSEQKEKPRSEAEVPVNYEKEKEVALSSIQSKITLVKEDFPWTQKATYEIAKGLNPEDTKKICDEINSNNGNLSEDLKKKINDLENRARQIYARQTLPVIGHLKSILENGGTSNPWVTKIFISNRNDGPDMNGAITVDYRSSKKEIEEFLGKIPDAKAYFEKRTKLLIKLSLLEKDFGVLVDLYSGLSGSERKEFRYFIAHDFTMSMDGHDRFLDNLRKLFSGEEGNTKVNDTNLVHVSLMSKDWTPGGGRASLLCGSSGGGPHLAETGFDHHPVLPGTIKTTWRLPALDKMDDLKHDYFAIKPSPAVLKKLLTENKVISDKDQEFIQSRNKHFDNDQQSINLLRTLVKLKAELFLKNGVRIPYEDSHTPSLAQIRNDKEIYEKLLSIEAGKIGTPASAAVPVFFTTYGSVGEPKFEIVSDELYASVRINNLKGVPISEILQNITKLPKEIPSFLKYRKELAVGTAGR